MKKILIASTNPGKIKEYNFILHNHGYEVLSLRDFPEMKEVEESGKTFLKNAMIKAKAASDVAGIPTIADDSGLEVEALKGAPGIYSRRFSAEATDLSNNQLLIQKMLLIENRNAKFVCEIVYYDKDSGFQSFHGEINGVILPVQKGSNGFGYDPLFYIPTEAKTMAELPESRKNEISHRAIALKKCLNALSGNIK